MLTGWVLYNASIHLSHFQSSHPFFHRWVLYNASIHLSPEECSTIAKKAPIPLLSEVLSEYFSIIKQTDYSSTEFDKDEMKERLTKILESISARNEPQFIAVKDSVENFLDYL